MIRILETLCPPPCRQTLYPCRKELQECCHTDVVDLLYAVLYLCIFPHLCGMEARAILPSPINCTWMVDSWAAYASIRQIQIPRTPKLRALLLLQHDTFLDHDHPISGSIRRKRERSQTTTWTGVEGRSMRWCLLSHSTYFLDDLIKTHKTHI